MKSWLKGGLIGGIILSLLSIILSWNSYYYGTWETNRLILNIIQTVAISFIWGFLLGWMVITVIKERKIRRTYYIPIIIFILHLIITLSLGFLIADDYLILLAPLLIGCVDGCSILNLILGVLLTSLSLSFISFLIILIIDKIKQRKQVVR